MATTRDEGAGGTASAVLDAAENIGDFPQFYHSTLFEPNGLLTAEVFVAPARSITDDDDLSSAVEELLDELKFRSIEEPTDVTRQTFAEYITAVAEQQETRFETMAGRDYLRAFLGEGSHYDAVVEALLERPLIPIERSPLSSEKLGKLIAEVGVAATPAVWAAYVVAPGENSPLLLLVLPAAVILFGAAHGVAKGLNKGLEAWAYNWVKPKRRRKNRDSES